MVSILLTPLFKLFPLIFFCQSDIHFYISDLAFLFVNVLHYLGVVHNCQHLWIRTERMEGGGGHDASVLFLNVDILLMLAPGGYD